MQEARAKKARAEANRAAGQSEESLRAAWRAAARRRVQEATAAAEANRVAERPEAAARAAERTARERAAEGRKARLSFLLLDAHVDAHGASTKSAAKSAARRFLADSATAASIAVPTYAASEEAVANDTTAEHPDKAVKAAGQGSDLRV